jgi:nucleoside-diphosphate-sugar epimerase
MKVLLTGANGYIGKRLLPVLLEQGHEVYACVRDRKRFAAEQQAAERLHVMVADFLRENPDDLFRLLPDPFHECQPG